MPMSSRWSLSLKFPHQNPVWTPLLTHTRATYPAHLNILDLNTNILWRRKIRKLLIMQSPPLPSNPVPLRPKYPPQSPALELPFYWTTFVSATLSRPTQLTYAPSILSSTLQRCSWSTSRSGRFTPKMTTPSNTGQ